MTEKIYTASDFQSGSNVFASASPPIMLGVFGDPVAHSKSPAFHNAALKACGIEAQYAKIHVTPEELTSSLRALGREGFLGANITIPHKSGALAVVDEAEEYARKSGAVNTIVVEGERLLGFNTDGPGLLRAIREEFSVDVRDLRVMVLGAGGAGRAIAVQCAMEGCERLVLVNRTVERARELVPELLSYFKNDKLEGPSERIVAIPNEEKEMRAQLDMTDLVINATSVGMKRSDAPLIPSSLLTPNLMVYDTVYASGKSRLVEDAESVGARAANGLSMLLHQGALSFEIWFNTEAPLEVMRSALKAAV